MLHKVQELELYIPLQVEHRREQGKQFNPEAVRYSPESHYLHIRAWLVELNSYLVHPLMTDIIGTHILAPSR